MRVNCDVWLNGNGIRIMESQTLGIVTLLSTEVGDSNATLFFGHSADPHEQTIARMTLLRDELTRQIEVMSAPDWPTDAVAVAVADDIPY